MLRTLLVILFCSLATPGFTQTQGQMNATADARYKQADKELNAVYQQVLKNYSKDPVFLKNLKNAQRIWIQLRDAELAAKYPQREAGYYGSIQPTCRASYLTDLTKQRTQHLRTWLTGTKEGDLCNGTVRIK